MWERGLDSNKPKTDVLQLPWCDLRYQNLKSYTASSVRPSGVLNVFVVLVFCTLSFKSQYDMSMCVGVGVLTRATAGTLKLWLLNTTIHLIGIHKIVLDTGVLG